MIFKNFSTLISYQAVTALFSLLFVYFYTSFHQTQKISCQEWFRESSYIPLLKTQAQSESVNSHYPEHASRLAKQVILISSK